MLCPATTASVWVSRVSLMEVTPTWPRSLAYLSVTLTRSVTRSGWGGEGPTRDWIWILVGLPPKVL